MLNYQRVHSTLIVLTRKSLLDLLRVIPSLLKKICHHGSISISTLNTHSTGAQLRQAAEKQFADELAEMGPEGPFFVRFASWCAYNCIIYL